MEIKVDISGRLDEFGEKSTIAFSNHLEGAIILSGSLKYSATQILRQQGKGRAFCKARIYVIALYLLLKPHLKKIRKVTLDKDFYGWEGEIVSMLTNYLRLENEKLTTERIDFDYVGNHRCHAVANATLKGKFSAFKADREEFLKLIPIKSSKKKKRVS